MVGESKKKAKVSSMINTPNKKQPNKKQAVKIIQNAISSSSTRDQKRKTRISSAQVQPTYTSKNKFIESVERKIENEAKQSKHQIHIQEQKPENPHFMTVADLQSGGIEDSSGSKNKTYSPVNDYQQESTLKNEGPSIEGSKIKVQHLEYQKELERNLDQTIGKLKMKQETIDILKRTINRRLVQGETKLSPSKRLDVYQVEINFYVDKISQLQKELHQKNRALASATQKNVEFGTMLKNNRKLIGENHRLREEKDLMERENNALRMLLMKKVSKH